MEQKQICYVVLAGDRRQYDVWKRENPDKGENSFYASNIYMVRGLRNFEVVKVGEWYRKYSSQDVDEIEMRSKL